MSFESSIFTERSPEVRELIRGELEVFGRKPGSTGEAAVRQTVTIADVGDYQHGEAINANQAEAVPEDVGAEIQRSDQAWAAWKGIN